MAVQYLDFEKPISELEKKIAELEALGTADDGPSIEDEVKRLKAKAEKQLADTYSNLSAWRKTQIARHPQRPHFADYVAALTEDYEPLSGDRAFGEDGALQGGLARFKGRSVVIMGHEKGSDTRSRIAHNFGMANPEGYRKAVRLMDLADRFSLPVISLIDTAGAYPGKAGEERGQAEAIARATQRGLKLGVPFAACIIGEGGSGGAIGIGAANKVFMLEHSIYSVISPEGCASILYRDPQKAGDAAEAMRITGQHLLKLGVVDGVVPEPLGGAHRDPEAAIAEAGRTLSRALKELSALSPAELRRQRRERFYAIGRTGL